MPARPLIWITPLVVFWLGGCSGPSTKPTDLDLIQSCQQDKNAKACATHAETLMKEPKTLPKAMTFLEHACSLLDGASCETLAELRSWGVGELENPFEQALEAMNQGCTLGNLHACLQLLQHDPNTTEADAAELAQRSEADCTTSHGDYPAHACYTLGFFYAAQGDSFQAVEYYSAACEANILTACRERDVVTLQTLGYFSLETTCAPGQQLSCVKSQDALRNLYQNCEKGDYEACVFAGSVHYFELKELDAALPLFSRGCEAWRPTGCVEAAYILLDQKAQEPTTIINYLERACDLGAAVGCNNLAAVYGSGAAGVTVDSERAAALYIKACDMGDAVACKNYALMVIESEIQIENGPYIALDYFERACTMGHENSCQNAIVTLQNLCSDGDQKACQRLQQ